MDKKDHKILGIQKWENSGNSIWALSVENLEPGRIYELSFTVKSASGSEMKSPFVQYTVQRLRRPSSDYRAKISKTQRGLKISLGGKPFATYDNTSSNKPIIWQVTGPNGQKMLRDWPLKKETPCLLYTSDAADE